MVTVLADLRNIYQVLLPAHILDPEEEAAAYYSHLNADQGQGQGLTSWLRAAFFSPHQPRHAATVPSNIQLHDRLST